MLMVSGKLMTLEDINKIRKREQHKNWQKTYYDTPKGREACLKAQAKYQKYRKLINLKKIEPIPVPIPSCISGIVVFD